MNRDIPPPRRIVGPGWVAIFVGVAVFFTLVWTQIQQSKARGHEAILQTLGEVPAFSLQDQSGNEITPASLAGAPWILGFISTRCTGSGPMITSRMIELQQILNRAQDTRVRLVSLSLDPEYDTPEKLSTHAAKTGADSTRWHFLTGSPADVQAFVTALFSQVFPESSEPPPAQITQFILVDPNGKIRGVREGENPEAVANLLMDIGALDREFRKASPSP